MSHTPGPWHVGTMNDALFVIDRPPAHFTDHPLPEGGPTIVIAAVAMLARPLAQSNAKLVAAAPEMLEAAQRALHHMLLRGWAVQVDHECREAYGQLKAAILKATGAK